MLAVKEPKFQRIFINLALFIPIVCFYQVSTKKKRMKDTELLVRSCENI